MKTKTLNAKELRSKKPAEIEKYIAELRTAQTELNHAIYTNKEKQTHQVGVLKKAVARAKTILAAQTALVREEE